MVFALIISANSVNGQNTINDIIIRNMDEVLPWFYSDTTFFCKYSYIKKIDVLTSDNKQKIKKARAALDKEDKTRLIDFKWPDDAIPGWKVVKPQNKSSERFVRTYFWGDTTDLRVAFQLEVRFTKGKPVLSYLESNEDLNRSFVIFLKSYFKEMNYDKLKRRKEAGVIKSFEKRFARNEELFRENERVVFEPEIRYSEKRAASNKWFFGEHFGRDRFEAMEKRVWWNPDLFPQKLNYWYREGEYQKVYNILVKTGLNNQQAFGGYSMESFWWKCKFQLGYFDEIIDEVKKGHYVDNFFESIFRAGRINEPHIFHPIGYIPYECYVYINDKESALEERNRLKNDEEFKKLEEHLKEHGEESLRPQYFAYHYTVLGDYEKAFHFHTLAKDIDGQIRVLLLSEKYEEALRRCSDLLEEFKDTSNQKVRIYCYELIANILQGNDFESSEIRFLDILKNGEFVRDNNFDTILLEGWIKNYLDAPASLKKEALRVIDMTKEFLNVISGK